MIYNLAISSFCVFGGNVSLLCHRYNNIPIIAVCVFNMNLQFTWKPEIQFSALSLGPHCGMRKLKSQVAKVSTVRSAFSPQLQMASVAVT